MTNRYPVEELDKLNEDDGTMQANVTELENAVIGHRIVNAEYRLAPNEDRYWTRGGALVLTLDDGREVTLHNADDCCAYTYLDDFWRDPNSVDHVIIGVGTTEQYTTWHIYADFGDIMRLNVRWSCGNPFYYGYGFSINVIEPD
jgi:hypothetical protein